MQKSNSQGFTISGTQLLDARKNEFIIRGVNNPHRWFYRESLKSLKELNRLNVNCIRIIWTSDGNAGKLDNILRNCIQLGMIPMIELHDATGSNKTDLLMKLVSYYTSDKIKDVLKKYEKYLLLNVANEWGDHHLPGETWKSTYMHAIDSLRNAGYICPIVIDAPGWGQNLEIVLQYGKILINHDPLKNILFSVHMYFYWNNPDKIEKELQKAHDMQLPLIVGEFGYNYDNGNNNLKCMVDHKTVLRKCQELGYGYMPWSWSGNNNDNAWLNMCDPNDWKTLTWWGRQLFEDENGITRTAKKASVFIQMKGNP